MKSQHTRWLMFSIRCLLLATLAYGGLNSAQAATTFDGFDDGNRTSTPSGIDWYTHSHPGNALGISIVDDSGGLGSGNALRVEPITTGQSIMGVFGTPIAVPAPIGSKLKLQFELRNNLDPAGPPGGTFRFGLYDADEVGFPAAGGFGGADGDWDAAQPGSSLDTGVYVQLDNSGNNSGNAGGCCTRLREETGTDGTQHGGGDVFNLAAPAVNTVFPGLNESNGKNVLSIEIERLAAGIGAGSLRYTYRLDNGLTVGTLTGVKLALPVQTSDAFDYVSMFYDGNNQWLIDNVTIETVAVPEPATWSLVGLAAVFGLFRRKRS